MRDAQADVPSAEWLRAQLAFKNSMVHGILQFTPSIAFCYVLHRCVSRDIRCRESFVITKMPHPMSTPRTGLHWDGQFFSLKFLGTSRAWVLLRQSDHQDDPLGQRGRHINGMPGRSNGCSIHPGMIVLTCSRVVLLCRLRQ